MALTAEKADRPERLEHDLQLALAPTPDLFSRVTADACTRIPVLRTREKPRNSIAWLRRARGPMPPSR